MNKTYIPTIVILALLAVLHVFAMENHIYVRYPGFDIFMHILGGAGLALFVYWFLVTFFSKHFQSGKPLFWTLLGFTVLLGIAWEVMESLYSIAGAPVGTGRYYLDTAKDIVNDTLGAIIATYFIERK